MAKPLPLNFALGISVLLVAGGFFIGAIGNSRAAGITLAYAGGNIASSSDWTFIGIDQKSSGGDDYFGMVKNTSAVVSPAIDLAGYREAVLSFKARSYGGISGTSSQIAISISLDGGESWSGLGSATPLSSVMADMATTSLAQYGGAIRLRFETLSATGSKGVGIDEIRVVASLPNQPPKPAAHISALAAAVDEELNFDGRDSRDDGAIVDWRWDFGDGHAANASTTRYSYATSGLFAVYLSVTDDEGAVATSTPLFVAVAERTASDTDPAASGTTFAPHDVAINEIAPAGASEWLELFNNSSTSINLSSWLLLDRFGSGWTTTTLSGIIPAGGYSVISHIAGSLNNSGDTVVLKDPSGQTIDQVSYDDFSNKSDASWARLIDGQGDAGGFAETISPTPGSANVISPRPAASRASGGAGSGTAIVATSSAPAAEAITPPYSGSIVINELYPVPGETMKDEFIELTNLSDRAIDVAGLIVSDGSKAKHAIKASSTAAASTLVQPGGYFVFWRDQSDIALNNSGLEIVSLYAPDLSLLDQVEYVGENKKGISYSRQSEGKWHWVSTPTPGAVNSSDELYPDEENPSVLGADGSVRLVGAVKSAGKGSIIQAALIAQLTEHSPGDKVRVKGVVSALPGAFGSQYFYIFNSNFGVQVYSNKKDFPELKIGDYIEVSGELSETSSGRRIKTSSRSQIRFLERRDPPVALPLAGSDFGEEQVGSLIAASGTVVEIQGKNLLIDDGATEVRAYISGQTDIKDVGAKPGDRIGIVGILGKTATGYRLMPRGVEDIRLTSPAVKGAFASAAPSSANNQADWYFLAIIAFLISIVVILIFKIKKIR